MMHFGVLVATDDQARARRLRRLSALQRRFDPVGKVVGKD